MTDVVLKPLSNRAQRKKLLARIEPSEHESQSLLFQWAALSLRRHPELVVMFAIPNFAGHHGSEQARIRSGAKAKREGRKAGVPDICLPVSRGPYHALYVEMKRRGEKAKTTQNDWHALLRSQGNAVRVCFSFDEARDVLVGYLALPVLYAKPVTADDFLSRR